MKLLQAAAALALGLGLLMANAQTIVDVPSPALDCLTPGPGARAQMPYPEREFDAREGGTVPVDLVFTDPTQPPRMIDRSTRESVSHAFVDAVALHVRKFRVPCLTPGAAPVTLSLEFVFVPNDGRKVVASEPRDAASSKRQQTLSCLVHRQGDMRPGYPAKSLRDEAQGHVLIRLRFTAPAAPPQAEVVAAPRARALVSAVLSFVDGLRLPCMGEEAVSVGQLYIFRIDGGPRVALRDMGLAQLVGGASDLPRAVYFDLDKMGCPFALRVEYYRPASRNIVEEIETSDARRRPLLDWISRITLNLPAPTANMVLGQQFDLRVPCGSVNL